MGVSVVVLGVPGADFEVSAEFGLTWGANHADAGRGIARG